ncbi:MAG TPA: hypothetical protein VGM54_06450 [Chthoniobacter sp.]|jgi:hypothetical protein
MDLTPQESAILAALPERGYGVLRPDQFGISLEDLRQITSDLQSRDFIDKHNLSMVGVNAELTLNGRAARS